MAEHAATNSGLALSNSSYDVLRFVVEKGFPGLGLLYAAFAGLWGWGYEVEVGGSLAALAVFGGLLLTFARKGYSVDPEIPPGGYDGEVVEGVNEDGQPTLKLQLDPSAVDDLLNKKQIVFKGYDPSA